MRFILVTALLYGCSDPCDSAERELPASGAIRHARFIEDDSIDVASASGTLVRSTCGGNLRVFDAGLTPRRAIDVDYELSDEEAIQALAVDADGTIAAITYELEYIGDIDEKVYTRLRLFDEDGRPRWSIVIEKDDITSPYHTVVIGADQVFVASDYGMVSAYARATGVMAWRHAVSDFGGVAIAADPAGGLTAAAPRQITSWDAAGEVRWSVAAEALGMSELDRVAQAADGSIAVVGSDGSLELESGQYVAMLDAAGALRWSQPFGQRLADRVTTIATDGARIIAAGDADDAFLVSIDPAGVTPLISVGGEGTHRAYVTSMSGEAVLAHVTSYDTDASPMLVIDDLAVPGIGTALLDIAR